MEKKILGINIDHLFEVYSNDNKEGYFKNLLQKLYLMTYTGTYRDWGI